MKKLSSILLVSMLAGSLALMGCDGGVVGNSSSSSTDSASTSSASSDNSAEDTASDVDVSVVGLYNESGYTNSYMGYQIDLPGEYT